MCILISTPLVLSQDLNKESNNPIGWIWNSITNLWEHWFEGKVIETSEINTNQIIII